MNLLKDGKKVIASNLCGIHIPINGMYVTYGTTPEKAAPKSDINYFWKGAKFTCIIKSKKNFRSNKYKPA